MIYLYTDFGVQDIYLGQMKAALLKRAPLIPVVDLFHGCAAFDVTTAAILLDALVGQLPDAQGDVFVAVVDPGVGGSRRAVAVQADGVWFVGPDNGLLSIVTGRAEHRQYYEILWRPERLSASFHGRDLFAPVASMLATDSLPGGSLRSIATLNVNLTAPERERVIYVDHYGNAMTGIPARLVVESDVLSVNGHVLGRAGVFSEVPKGQAFWYVNSLELVEIAVNGGSAAEKLGIGVGMPVSWVRE